MTHVEQIITLPKHQRRAAQALMGRIDDRLVSDAVHARVPDPIVSFLTGLSVERVHAVTQDVDARDRELARLIAA